MRIITGRVLLVLIGVLAIAAAPAAAQTAFWECPVGFEGQSLHVYNWTTYIAEDTISNFERLCGVDVTYTTYASDTDMLEELRAGSTDYDVVVPTDATVYLMIDDGLLQPLNLSQIANISNVSDQFRGTPYDPNGEYTAAYQWGTIGVGYNRAAVGGEITSWDQVFNYDGPVAWLDESRSMMGIVLRVLGYDANTDDPAQLAEARDYLIAHSANVVEVAPDTGQDLLANGQADIVVEYSGDIFQVIADCGCDTYAYAIPDEGAVIWNDSLTIPSGARNPALARVFIDYILVPQVGADISNYTAYASPNQTAIDEGLIDSQYLNSPIIYPDDALLERLVFIVNNARLEQLFADEWTRVVSEVGR
jgi:spermidine/putrescine transport system substrate-binding protein